MGRDDSEADTESSVSTNEDGAAGETNLDAATIDFLNETIAARSLRIPYQGAKLSTTDYVAYLGIDLVLEPELAWIAREMCAAPMPPNAEMLFSQSNIVYFHDTDNDYYTLEHPLTNRFLKVLERQRLDLVAMRTKPSVNKVENRMPNEVVEISVPFVIATGCLANLIVDVFCGSCDDYFCFQCFQQLHRKGFRSDHHAQLVTASDGDMVDQHKKKCMECWLLMKQKFSSQFARKDVAEKASRQTLQELRETVMATALANPMEDISRTEQALNQAHRPSAANDIMNPSGTEKSARIDLMVPLYGGSSRFEPVDFEKVDLAEIAEEANRDSVAARLRNDQLAKKKQMADPSRPPADVRTLLNVDQRVDSNKLQKESMSSMMQRVGDDISEDVAELRLQKGGYRNRCSSTVVDVNGVVLMSSTWVREITRVAIMRPGTSQRSRRSSARLRHSIARSPVDYSHIEKRITQPEAEHVQLPAAPTAEVSTGKRRKVEPTEVAVPSGNVNELTEWILKESGLKRNRRLQQLMNMTLEELVQDLNQHEAARMENDGITVDFTSAGAVKQRYEALASLFVGGSNRHLQNYVRCVEALSKSAIRKARFLRLLLSTAI
ncbi:hypothetical protein FOL47_007166 [Perkinsus chesapeaki]|uniref:Uncharacterized protein n=1 Tax=Perkinsus chesapeaki TaxID=330153 RepID=A0A7J6LMG5_PERCH|nr:hypothetical protein FOL47_007166 [Perkinsus chesapeaki]